VRKESLAMANNFKKLQDENGVIDGAYHGSSLEVFHT